MTRRAVYGIGLLLTLACTAMTIASISMPRWVSYSPNHKRVRSIGLHSDCSSITGTCTSFPQKRDCTGNFCHTWRTVGFLISFSVVVELATLVSFVVIISGGVQRRAAGWKIASGLLLFGGIVQCAGMAIVEADREDKGAVANHTKAYLYDHEQRFYEGWYLDASWSLCTVSWSALVLSSLGITASALYLPSEGGYELIPSDHLEIEQDDQLQSRIAGWNDGFRSESGYQNDRD